MILNPLLAADEPPVVRYAGAEPGQAESRWLLLCDHAGKRVPRALGTLGLDDHELSRHIGWDPGAEPLTRALLKRTPAAALLGSYSRLVIDLNRFPSAAASIPEMSDTTHIPGNIGLSAAEREQRVETLFRPYHEAVDAALDACHEGQSPPWLLLVHTFTRALRADGIERPWEVALLSGPDRQLTDPALDWLRAQGRWTVGDNQPYDARIPYGYTDVTYGERRGTPYILVEIRQDLLTTAQGVEQWADILWAMMQAVEDHADA
ncbi:N-formylglutamate amidohydrolase [Gammaproteobacteria bacterium]|nr:N-formylglutamate amidohydrolase [Gammaproteobacteria bacterium]